VKICRRFFTVLAFCWLSALAVKASAQLTKVTTSYVSKPEDFVDSRFIKELDDSGYIDNLYMAKPR